MACRDWANCCDDVMDQWRFHKEQLQEMTKDEVVSHLSMTIKGLRDTLDTALAEVEDYLITLEKGADHLGNM